MKKRLSMLRGVIAQTKVTGTVISQEDGQPIIGAAVQVEGTKTGMLTDVNGKFSLTLPEGKKQIRVSYLGYEAKTVDAKNGMRVFLKAAGEWGTYLAATTLRVFTYQALVDAYGSIPYSEAFDT